MGADRDGLPRPVVVGILPPDVPCYDPATAQAAGDVLLSLRSVERGSAAKVIPLAVFATATEASDFFAEEFGSLPHCFPVIRPLR